MPVSVHDIAVRAFATKEWRAAADAFFQATGVVLSVMDFERCELLAGTHRCSYCNLASDVSEPGPLTCFDTCPSADAGPGRIICRSGLATLYAPVMRGEKVVAHLVISSFVTSTRERRGLYEQLLSRGVNEASARRSIKSLPVIPRRQAESYLQMAVASAHTVVDSTAERMMAAEKVEELRLFVSAGRQVVSTEKLDSASLGAIADEAVALVNGEAGAILRPRGSMLEVVARTPEWRGSLGALVPKANTASGRAVESGRTVVAPGRGQASSVLAMPLTMGERVLGILEVRLPQSAVPLSQDRLSRLGRFGQFIAVALEREDERAAVERAMTGYAQLNELAAALGGQTDVSGVAQLVASVMEKAFCFQLSGLILTSWGQDRADIAIDGDVSQGDLAHVLGIVAGRDTEAEPFDTLRTVTHRGSVKPGASASEWAVSPVRLAYGELDVGWLFVARNDGERYGRQDHALLEGIAAHAGAAFGRAALFSRIRDDYAKTIAALSATLDYGERSPKGHASRVMDYSMLIGEELELPFEQIEQLRFAGLLHDVGKTGVPEEILLKPSNLTFEEMQAVRRHAEIGASIVDQIDFLKSLTPVILHHHERWDGQGYPEGLAGDRIPLLARILAVADSFDAMLTTRSYRKKLSIAQARIELEEASGSQYDPTVVTALFEALDRQAAAGNTGLFAHKGVQGAPGLPV